MHADEPDVERESNTPELQSYETADGVVFTDERNPNAWLESSFVVDLWDGR